MPRLARGQLSYVERKGFRASVGFYLKDGKRTPKVFWLGHDPLIAHCYADQARGSWQAITLTGGAVWTEERLDDLKEAVAFFIRARAAVFAKHAQHKRALEEHAQKHDQMGELLNAMFGTPERQKPTDTEPVASPTRAKLYATLDAYDKAMTAKALSPSYKRRVTECVEALKTYRPDVELGEIDRVWLETLTDEIKARPLSRKKDGQTGKREPIKPGTVKTLLQHWRQTFDWIDRGSDSDRFSHWEAPKRMNDLFACDLNALRTKVERDKAADGPEQLTVAEIKKLIHHGNDRQRMLMLMGLFAGMGQTELRWCRRDEFDLAAARFKHRRNKTGQQGGGPITTIADTSGPFSIIRDTPDINALGTVAFIAGLDAGGIGVFTGNGGAVTTIADSGGPFSTFTTTGPSMNASGMVAFVANLDAGGSGVFAGSGGPITTIVDTSGPYSGFPAIAGINGPGKVVFRANLDAGGGGIFTGPNPLTDKVIAIGDPLFSSTVASLGLFRAINDNGNVAFYYTLANGVSGVAVANVPEPSGVHALLATAAALVVLRRRSKTC